MDKTLSQEEVDALLQAMKTGEVAVDEKAAAAPSGEEVKVIAYNFRKPRLISGDQLQGFQVLHDIFVKSLQSSLFVTLKNAVEVKLVAIDQFTYGEFILSLLRPTYIAVMSTSPNVGDIAIEMNLPMVMSMIDILLGGDGGTVQEPRELTPIEQAISSDIMNVVTTELKSAWSSVADIDFQTQSFESNPEYIQLTTSEALVLSVTLDMRMGELSGVMNICYPFAMIQPMLHRFSARIGGGKRDATRSEKKHEEMLAAMGQVELGVHAVLGRTHVTASEVANLKPRDIICLDNRCATPLEVHVGDRLCYYAEAGKFHKRAAIRLLYDKHEAEDRRKGSATISKQV